MLALALSMLVLHAAPDAGTPKKLGPGPSAYDTAKLFYLAGDLANAQEWARRGLKREPKTCGPLNVRLAEYNSMASHYEEFTPEEAKTFLELDRKISPTVRGKVTEKAFARFVTKPLSLATEQAKGDVPRALQLIDQVLFVDAKNAEALALKARLTADAGR
jgi:hypothetical protein